MLDHDRRDPAADARLGGGEHRARVAGRRGCRPCAGRARSRAAAAAPIRARSTRPSPCAAVSTAEQLVGAVDDAFAEQIAEDEVLEIGRRGEDHEPGDAVDLDRHRHLVGDPLLDLGAAAAAQRPRRHPRHAGGHRLGRGGVLARGTIEVAAGVGEQEGGDAGGIVEVEDRQGRRRRQPRADRRWRWRRCADPRRSAPACRSPARQTSIFGSAARLNPSTSTQSQGASSAIRSCTVGSARPANSRIFARRRSEAITTSRGAGLPVPPRVLAFVVDVEAVVRVLDDRDALPGRAQRRDQPLGERGLAGTGEAAEADDVHRQGKEVVTRAAGGSFDAGARPGTWARSLGGARRQAPARTAADNSSHARHLAGERLSRAAA